MKISLPPATRAWLVDTGERVGSTVVEAGLAYLTTRLASLPAIYVVLLTPGLAALKAQIAKLIPTDSVSPASFAPAQQPGQEQQAAPPAPDQPVPADPSAAPGVFLSSPDMTVVLLERRVKGKPLGRHVHHDERSRAYPFIPRHTGPLIPVRHKRHVPPFDQGDLGSCTGNACAGALSTAPFAHRFTETRARKIYSDATKIDNVPGSWPPDDTGSDGLSVAKIAVRNGWATRYEHCFDLQSVLAALQVGPVMLGVSWRSGFDNPAADGRMAYTGTVRGGHEPLADEIDVENQRVWITNSWGLSWGVKGRAYWTFDDLAKVLADQGDATVLIH